MVIAMSNLIVSYCALAAISALAASGAGRQDVAQDGPLLSVCDVMSRLSRLKEKKVLVLALVTNAGKGIAADCEQCAKCLTTGEYQWANSINIHLAVRRLRDLVRDHYSRREIGVIALQGVVRVKYRKRLWPFGRKEIDVGFGHLGAYPVQIDVTSIRSCAIEPVAICSYGLPLDVKHCSEISVVGAEGGRPQTVGAR
jgi:hypothetical protein